MEQLWHPIVGLVMLQAWLVAFTGSGVGVVDLGPVNLLERIHGADGTDQFQRAVIAEQITGAIERQRRDAVRRHEVTHLQAHLFEILIRQRVFILLVFKAQYRMLVFSSTVGLAAGNAQADDWRFGKVLLIHRRVDQALEQLAMQRAKMLRGAEGSLVLVVRQQHDAEIVIAHVRREIVADHARDALAGGVIDDVGFKNFDQGQRVIVAVIAHAHFDGNNFKLDTVTIPLWVVPVRQGVEPVVDHLQRVAHVLLTARAPCQVGEVGGDTRRFSRPILLVKTNALYGKLEICACHDRPPHSNIQIVA